MPEHVISPVIQLQWILQALPAAHYADPKRTILWDTLKIDAQGVDKLVVHGGGELLAHFACIIGEFDKSAYVLKRNFNYRHYLYVELGFVMISKHLYANPRFIDGFRSGKYLCSAPDVRISRKHVLRYLEKALFARANKTTSSTSRDE